MYVVSKVQNYLLVNFKCTIHDKKRKIFNQYLLLYTLNTNTLIFTNNMCFINIDYQHVHIHILNKDQYSEKTPTVKTSVINGRTLQASIMKSLGI